MLVIILFANDKVSSHKGMHSEPSLTLSFSSADYAFNTLLNADMNTFMQGIQQQDIKVTGDYNLSMWFMGLMKYIRPQKK